MLSTSLVVTCIVFTPNAPEQNPVEDVWLRGKSFLRKHFNENNTFHKVKMSFLNFLNNKVFNIINVWLVFGYSTT
jgi:hypothetical protein